VMRCRVMVELSIVKSGVGNVLYGDARVKRCEVW